MQLHCPLYTSGNKLISVLLLGEKEVEIHFKQEGIKNCIQEAFGNSFKARPETTLYLAFPKHGSSFNNLICPKKDERNAQWHVRSKAFSAVLTSSACQGGKQSGECVSVTCPKRERRKRNAEMINNNSARQSAARRKWFLFGALANSSAHLQGLPADQGRTRGGKQENWHHSSACAIH